MIECQTHGIEYDFMIEMCPKCTEEIEAAKRIVKRLTCGLCGQMKADVQIMCGGAIDRLCLRCRDLIFKWKKAKREQKERFDEIRSSRGKANNGV